MYYKNTTLFQYIYIYIFDVQIQKKKEKKKTLVDGHGLAPGFNMLTM